MSDIRVSFDATRYKTKPNGYDVASITDKIARNIKSYSHDKIKSFASLVGNEGCTFCPATFKEIKDDFGFSRKKKENFDQLQLLVLDFDNDKPDNQISIEAVKDRAEKFDLPILFAYKTLSSKPEQSKFRAVLLNDISIPDRKVAEATHQALGTIFPEADSSCYKDVSRMYFGGKGLLYFDENIPEVSLESVFRGMTYYLKVKYKHHYKDRISKFSIETGIGLNKNGLLDVTVVESPTEHAGANQIVQNGKNSPSSIIYSLNRIADGEIFQSRQYRINLCNDSDTNKPSVGKKIYKNHETYRSSTLKDIDHECLLFRDFNTGSRKLSHDELFGIATNLIQIDSGSQKFKDIMSEHTGFYDGKRNKWDHDLAYMKQLDYKPQSCSSFCPYKDECVHGTNILSSVKPKRGTMEPIPGYKEELVSVAELQDEVYHAISKALRPTSRPIEVIKAMTGAGKSFAYRKLMSENSTTRFLIAASSNILKDEIFNKAVEEGLDVIKTPSLEADEVRSAIPLKVREYIKRLYNTGQHRSVHPYIYETLKKKSIPPLEEYIEEREKLKNFNGSVITTHRYFMNMDEKRLREYDAVIIDEDIILKSVISNQAEITISDLKKLLKETTDSRLSKKIKRLLKLAETETCIELNSFEYDDEDGAADGISTPFDISSFCLTEKFYVRRASKERSLKQDTIAYIKPVIFKNVKCIVVSATADEDIYRKLFGEENVSFCECKKAPYKGDLFQYPGKSMSRTSIDNNEGIIERLIKRFGIDRDKVITFLKYGIGLVHFGNTEGVNTLEGKDILVIGTPYHAEFLYKLVAFTLGFNFDEEAEMKSQLVMRNGFRFVFNTYEDEALRNIHLWMIESELEQAVGRPRLLRHKCVVHLFSNFALSQATVIDDFDYDNSAADDGTVEGERKELC